MDEIDITDVEVRSVGMAVLDRAGVVVSHNETWASLARNTGREVPEGYDVGDSLLSACERDVAHRELAAAIRAALSGTLAPAQAVRVPARVDDGDGRGGAMVTARTNETGAVIGATVALMSLPVADTRSDGRAPGAELRFSAALSLVAGALCDAVSIDQVYTAVAAGAHLVGDSDAAVLNLLTNDGDAVRNVAATGAHAGELAGHEMPIGECVSGQVIKTGQPVIVEDCEIDQSVWRPAADVGRVGPALIVPLMDRNGSAFGVLSVNNLVGGRGFSGTCLAELTRFAHHVAIYIQTAQRFVADDTAPVDASTTPMELLALSDVDDSDHGVGWFMVEACPDAVVMVDEQGLIELVNSRSEKLFGYDRVELLGRPVEMLIPDRFAQSHVAHRAAFRSSPEVREMGSGLDLTALRNDGVEIPVEVSLSPLEAQGTLRTLVLVRDISDRVLAEAEARSIRTTIDATHDGVFMFPADAGLRFTYVNQGATDQTGYSRAELLTMTPLDIKPEFTRDSFEETIAPLVAGEIERLTFTTVHRRKDGRDVPVEIILEYPDATAMSSARTMVALVRDISERIHMELLQERERIGRDMHDNVIGRLFAAGMNMQATLAQIADPFAKDRMTKAVVEIDEAIREIRTTVFGLRSAADWGSGLKGEILALAADQNDALGFEPTVTLAGPVDDLPASTRRNLLAVLREALTNVVKHAQARRVAVDVTATQNEVQVSIVDDGVGFAPDPTKLGPDVVSGLGGNGLANIVVRAEELGGWARIDSTAGDGTTIEWSVPIS